MDGINTPRPTTCTLAVIDGGLNVNPRVYASPRFPENVLTPERAYAETCANIRAPTKSVSSCWASFRLSGATLLTFFLKEQVAAEKVSLVITLSLFAALITLRNI